MRSHFALGSIAALVFATVGTPVEGVSDTAREPVAPNRHKPSGSKPVPGGGARERERMLRRMKKATS